ncbi:hypothetical protein J6590_073034 [Homalodisca vitripennis]|nr:hypothetical protein J6590_073034 [Homalodisca vitripennis]
MTGEWWENRSISPNSIRQGVVNTRPSVNGPTDKSQSRGPDQELPMGAWTWLMGNSPKVMRNVPAFTVLRVCLARHVGPGWPLNSAREEPEIQLPAISFVL